MNYREIIERLYELHNISDDEIIEILKSNDENVMSLLREYSQKAVKKVYCNKIFIRGLIEFTNFCKNDCYYCGIRRSNRNADRYRLTKEDILSCCKEGYSLGFRTFVLQGGEDRFFSTDDMCDIISSVKGTYPDCAVTLSIGEQEYSNYKAYFDAGADRYLLRQETSNKAHYNRLHPKSMSFENRRNCLYNLKEIGYQVGCGFMIGSPYQTLEDIVLDLRFMEKLKPSMIGIGPFISHQDTPFAYEKCGSFYLTLKLISIIRLMMNDVLLPSTTALGTIHPKGRELGILHGANVVMPNLSPQSVRKKYSLYNGKISFGEESAQCKKLLEKQMKAIGYDVVVDRGDNVNFSKQN